MTYHELYDKLHDNLRVRLENEEGTIRVALELRNPDRPKEWIVIDKDSCPASYPREDH